MDERFRDIVIETLRKGEELPADWARALFPPEKREYELVYQGKEREEEILADTMAVPLQPVRSFGKNNGWENMLIFGDNLQAMRTLLEMKKAGRLTNADGTNGVRLVYIDPPFATKRDFQASDQQRAYQDKVRGAEFVEFIRRRLVLLRELIADDGCLFLHLDVKKIHYMKVILDEVFGEGRFVNEIIWKRTSAHSDSTTYANVHDGLLFYSKSAEFTFNQQFTSYTEEHVNERYKHVETKGPRKGERFADGDLVGTGLRGGGYPYKWKGVFRTWRCPIETMRKYEKEDRLYYTRGGVARIKRYLDDVQGVPLPDVWTDIFPVNSQASERTGYPTQKPETLLERIITACSKPGDIVLDAFAGSGTAPAVAEKLDRRWIAMDCGKLAIYTIQKRMLHLNKEIGNKGKPLVPKPFTLYNAGLYDFASLRKLPWKDWRFFALQLFGCRDEPHKIGRMQLDGKLKGSSVLVFNHHEHAGKRIDEETVHDIHLAIGKQVGKRFFIVAPRGVFDFQQDYIDFDGVRYYALRIPYSIINELHARAFTALRQPRDEANINDTVDAVGFDFIRPPELKWKAGSKKATGAATLALKSFETSTRVRGEDVASGFDSFAMLMLDFDYDGEIFEMDEFWLSQDLKKDEWLASFDSAAIGKQVMAVFIDIYGNESRVVIPRSEFGLSAPKATTKKERVHVAAGI